MRPRDVIIKWIDTFNEANAEKLAEFYHENATNHQVANTPIVGKENIRQMFINEFKNAKMVCILENIFEDGQWVIIEWKDPLGFRGCGFFLIEKGKIKFQRGYWDKLSFLKIHNLPIPS